jgi:hypothetical protein
VPIAFRRRDSARPEFDARPVGRPGCSCKRQQFKRSASCRFAASHGKSYKVFCIPPDGKLTTRENRLDNTLWHYAIDTYALNSIQEKSHKASCANNSTPIEKKDVAGNPGVSVSECRSVLIRYAGTLGQAIRQTGSGQLLK